MAEKFNRKYICKKDLYMTDGTKVFTKGYIYIDRYNASVDSHCFYPSNDGLLFINDINELHTVNRGKNTKDRKYWRKYFVLATPQNIAKYG